MQKYHLTYGIEKPPRSCCGEKVSLTDMVGQNAGGGDGDPNGQVRERGEESVLLNFEVEDLPQVSRQVVEQEVERKVLRHVRREDCPHGLGPQDRPPRRLPPDLRTFCVSPRDVSLLADCDVGMLIRSVVNEFHPCWKQYKMVSFKVNKGFYVFSSSFVQRAHLRTKQPPMLQTRRTQTASRKRRRGGRSAAGRRRCPCGRLRR